MHADVLDAPEAADRIRDDWDRLAVAASLPYATPAWQLGWWREAAPADARLRVLVARDGGDDVAGVLGLFAERAAGGVWRLRLLGAPLAQGTSPLARAGREAECAAAFAAALAGLRDPRPATLELEGVPGGRRFAERLAGAWPGPGRPAVRGVREVPAPYASLDHADLDGWLASRSANFRAQMRRSRRRLEDDGAVIARATTAAEIERVLPGLLRLHEARWASRGGSRAVDTTSAAVVGAAAGALAADGRAHVEVIEHAGRLISAHLFLAAGDETTYWLGGFDDAYAAGRPGLVALVDAVGQILERGGRRLDLGPGDDDYKRRFADGERTLDWQQVLLPGPRRPLTRLQLAPRRLAREAKRRAGRS